MIELSVNIDHIATLRQARRTYEPDPIWGAIEAHIGGANGITVHLREDRRHIQDADLKKLRDLTQIKLNLEIGATEEMIAIACEIRPDMVMLVPEGRLEITTEGGLDIVGQEYQLSQIIQCLRETGIAISMFIDANLFQVEAASRIGAQVCEVHTGPYANAFYKYGRSTSHPAVRKELSRIIEAGEKISDLGMRFNAGHALNYYNVSPIARLANISELHIGHAIVSRSIFIGFRNAVRQMKELIYDATQSIHVEQHNTFRT